ELYDVGLGFDPNWQPLITLLSPSVVRSGKGLTVYGSGFKGVSEASGGNESQKCSSNYPLVKLLSLANQQTLFLPLNETQWCSTRSFTAAPVPLMTTTSSGFPIGYALITVFTNGIPSESQFVFVQPPNRQR